MYTLNNLHIISLYKLHNKLSCESCLLRSSCRASRVECVEPCCSTSSTQPNCMGLTPQTCRVETWQAKWNLGYSGTFPVYSLYETLNSKRLHATLQKMITSSLLLTPNLYSARTFTQIRYKFWTFPLTSATGADKKQANRKLKFFFEIIIFIPKVPQSEHFFTINNG